MDHKSIQFVLQIFIILSLIKQQMPQRRIFCRGRFSENHSFIDKKPISPSLFRQTAASNHLSSESDLRAPKYNQSKSFSQTKFRSQSEQKNKIKRGSSFNYQKRKKEDEQKSILKTISQSYYRPQMSSCKRNRTDIKKRFTRQKFRKQKNIKQSIFSIENGASLLNFSKQLNELEEQFVNNFKNNEFQKCSQILLKILNYSIDVHSKQWFIKVIDKLSEFHLKIGDYTKSLFYYNQLRQSAILLSQKKYLIGSLIGMAKSCSKSNFFMTSITFLKKALQYSWYYNDENQELKVYDEIGKVYYLDGNIEKAKAYHEKYMCAKKQPTNSPQRILSAQRICKQESINLSSLQSSINKIFLINLDLPIMSTKQLPTLYSCIPYDQISQRDEQSENQSQYMTLHNDDQYQNKVNQRPNLRDLIKINQKYKSNIGNFQNVLSRILKNWIFYYQMEEPDLSITNEKQSKIFYKGNFKLWKDLKERTGNNLTNEKSTPEINYKKTLDEKVKEKINEPGLEPDWDIKLAKQVKRDRKNKLFKVQNQIRIRDKDKPQKLQAPQIKKLFVSFFN